MTSIMTTGTMTATGMNDNDRCFLTTTVLPVETIGVLQDAPLSSRLFWWKLQSWIARGF